jgi:chemotaxis protein methyltransferase CheR
MTRGELAYFRAILKERSGLNLGDDQLSMLEARLKPLMKEFGFTSFAELVAASVRPEAEYLRTRIAQAVTVQESYFFRDKAPFQFFAETILPSLILARRATKRIRIWCAAVSWGQEPYSLAMLIAEQRAALKDYEVELYATDFARDAVTKAKRGRYSQFEVQRGLPVSYLIKYFNQVDRGWEVRPEIRSMIRFSEHNLLRQPPAQDIDVIFCRNVLIYFDEATKRTVLGELAGALSPGGWLVLGAAETARGLNHDLVAPEGAPRGIYRLEKPITATHYGHHETAMHSGGARRAAGGSR